MSNHDYSDIKLNFEDRGYYISEEDYKDLRASINDMFIHIDKMDAVHNEHIELINKDARKKKIITFLVGMCAGITFHAGIALIFTGIANIFMS